MAVRQPKANTRAVTSEAQPLNKPDLTLPVPDGIFDEGELDCTCETPLPLEARHLAGEAGLCRDPGWSSGRTTFVHPLYFHSFRDSRTEQM